MEIQEYILKTLKDYTLKYPSLKLRYLNDKYPESHIIEVLPKMMYDDVAFRNDCADFIYKCYKDYPGEDVFFITEDDVLHFENETASFKGLEYINDKI